jgi:hypothetical protein
MIEKKKRLAFVNEVENLMVVGEKFLLLGVAGDFLL